MDLDVPLLGMQSRPNAQGVFADPATRQVIDVLAALQRRDSRLYSWVSEASQMKDGVRLELRSPAGAQALLKKMVVIRPEVQRVLDKLTNVPVDIEPRFVTAAKLLAK